MSTHPDPRSFDCTGADAAAVVPATSSETLPAPAPAHAPLETERQDGWTPSRQAAFLRELAATHNVSAAARSVGMSRQSAYKLRARMRGMPFDAAWRAAFLTRFDALAEAAMDRALNGVEVPHYYNGELLGTSRRFDERLTLALLARRGDFTPPRASDYDPASAFEADDLGALIERVEHGPEDWRENPNDELDARYGGNDEQGRGAIADDEADGGENSAINSDG